MLCACCAPAAEDSGELRAGATQPYGAQTADPTRPANSRSSSSGARGRARGGRTTGVTFDMVLTDLEAAEQKVYSQAFAQLPGGSSGLVPLDKEELRSFLQANSAVEVTELDT